MKKQTSNVSNVNKTSNKSTAIVGEAKKHLNVRYVWGGTTPKGFDCSGFLKYVFEKGAGVTLPRTVSGIYKKGTKGFKPQVGDLVWSFMRSINLAPHMLVYFILEVIKSSQLIISWCKHFLHG
ncbi:C40 family peptidase [Peribacillus simplex]|uniref:C40 family peptidase n=1 Tax=Peribacillus simplex TaxID=1478 RepID=UPI00366E8130